MPFDVFSFIATGTSVSTVTTTISRRLERGFLRAVSLQSPTNPLHAMIVLYPKGVRRIQASTPEEPRLGMVLAEGWTRLSNNGSDPGGDSLRWDGNIPISDDSGLTITVDNSFGTDQRCNFGYAYVKPGGQP